MLVLDKIQNPIRAVKTLLYKKAYRDTVYQNVTTIQHWRRVIWDCNTYTKDWYLKGGKLGQYAGGRCNWLCRWEWKRGLRSGIFSSCHCFLWLISSCVDIDLHHLHLIIILFVVIRMKWITADHAVTADICQTTCRATSCGTNYSTYQSLITVTHPNHNHLIVLTELCNNGD